jgi:tetrapyrrole methylase family protein/MazG family protein
LIPSIIACGIVASFVWTSKHAARKIYHATGRQEKSQRQGGSFVSDRETEQKFGELLDVMARLRSETGCPWDKEQTHVSLKPCLLEETYELLDALDDGDPKKLKEELGDVLLQVVFHSQIASEERAFSAKDVIAQLTDKLIRRHPYVFAGEPIPEDTASVLKQRLRIKASEKEEGEVKSALGNVPQAMPALARAQSISRRAAHLGFEWPHIDHVWNKVEEEIRELKEAAASGDKSRTTEELGDLFFTLVNIARFLDVEAEDSLAQMVNRFTQRFQYIENKLAEAKKSFDQSSLEEMDQFWEEAKKLEARKKSST